MPAGGGTRVAYSGSPLRGIALLPAGRPAHPV